MSETARLLVVEDESIVAMDLADTLRQLHYEVVGVVSSGEAAVSTATVAQPDLILMDVRLRGDMNGIEAAQLIRSNLQIPVVFLTAHGDAATLARTALAAPYGYLVKPVDHRELQRAIEIALGRRREERAERERAADALWESEERFQLLVDAVQDYALMLVDLDGRIVSWNSGATRMTGWQPEEVTGLSISILRLPEERAPEILRGELDRATKLGRDELEGWRVRKDGSTFWAHAIRTAVVDRSGRLRGIASITRDMTEKRALEAQLHAAQKLESLGELAGGIAHDFNNMLMVIMARVELLQRMLGSVQPAQHYLDDIRAAATRNRDLTQQLVAAARKQILQPQALLLSDTVESTMKLLAPTLGENILKLLDLDAPLWSVYADPGKLNQVVMNLALNARDAMPGGGRLTIEARNLRADETYARQHPAVRRGDYVQLIVSDNGIGIPPNVREHIFDPFFSTKSTGTGLGLAVVRGIIEQTGGHIWVYSEVGEGTTFKILLPRHAGDAERAQDQPEPLPLYGHETILLVEDEQLLRAVVKDTLEEHGYRVLEAAAAAEALAISRGFPDTIDLLLTDVIMPEVTGPALAEILLKERPRMRVIFTSGYTDDVIVHHGVLDPGVRFLEKPATTNTLLRAVTEALS
jgi:hypothetical protein